MAYFKRVMALVLTLAMVISVLPVQAMAQERTAGLGKVLELTNVMDQILKKDTASAAGETNSAQQTEAASEPTVVTEALPEETNSASEPASVPNVLPEQDAAVLSTTEDYTYTVSGDGTATITGYTGTDTELVIPDTLDGYPVTGIGESAFEGNTSLITVDIPDSVTEIDNWAFSGCTALASVTLSKGLTTLGGRAFYNCDALTTIEIPKSLTETTTAHYNEGGWGDRYGVFDHCDNLKTVTFEEGTTEVAIGLFARCYGLESIVIPDTVTVIEAEAFYLCSGLKDVTLSKATTSIHTSAFEGCTSLTAIVIPDSVTEIDNWAFSDCTALASVTLSRGLTTLGGRAFYNCDALTTIEIPRSLTETTTAWYNEGGWGDRYGVFDHCDNLKTATFEEGTTKVAIGLFARCYGLESIVIPDTVTVIEYEAFRLCRNLKDVTLSNKLTTIDGSAFNGCAALEYLYVPDSVTAIGSKAFNNCPNLCILCSSNSYALEYAMNNNLLAKITNWSRPESDIVDMANSYFNTNTVGTNASGYIDLVVHYALKPEQLAQLSDMKLRILLHGKLVLIENSLLLDGEVPLGYSYKDNVLTVPVTKESGTLRFSVNPESASLLFSRAEFLYKKDGTAGSVVIDCLNSDMPVLTMVVPRTVNTSKVMVSGIAPEEAALTFFIDDVQSGTAVASKAGNYSLELKLPDVQDGKSYRIKVIATAGDTTVEKTMTVTYDLATPVLEELILYYSGHETGRYENYVVDLTDPKAGYTVITFNPTHEYIFRVKMSNPDQISHLYVTSTRNGQTKYIEAKYDAKTGYFVTKDKFDNDVWNYVPGEIGVIYDRLYPELDPSDLEGTAETMIDSAVESLEGTDIQVEVSESDEKNLNVQLTMPGNGTLGFEYHEYTQKQLVDKLVELGIMDPIDINAASPNDYVVSDLLFNYFKHFVVEGKNYFFGQTEDGQTVSVTPTYSEDTGTEIFMVWLTDAGNSTVYDILMKDNLECEDLYIIPYKDQNSLIKPPDSYSTGKDVFFAAIKFGTNMWELQIEKQNATPERLQEIEEAEMVLTQVLIARLALAAVKYYALPLLCPGAAIGLSIACFVMEDILSSAEQEGDWVRGFENSAVGSIMMMAAGFVNGIFDAICSFFNLLKWIIDPSGYVYEAVTTNRLPGVTATVYFQDPETGEAVLWNAGEYDQINPMITGIDGVYAWDVPEGQWQVKYELEGYETVCSQWMPVPPPQTDVNVGLISYAVPEAQWIDVYHDGVEIWFSKYMIPDTVDDIVLTDELGNEITYTLEYSTGETAADGTVFAKCYTLNFDSVVLNQGAVCTISIPETVLSYAGVAAKTAITEVVCTEQILIQAAETVTVPYGQQVKIPVSLSVDGIDTIEVVSMFAELVSVESLVQTKDGWQITLAGNLPGRTAILISVPGTNVSKYVEVYVDASVETHTHAYTVESTTSPTCTEQGHTTYTCTVCGHSYVDDYVDALGHEYESEVVDPTCTEQGCTRYICTRCEDTYADTFVAALGHDFGEWAAWENGLERRDCSRCEEYETREAEIILAAPVVKASNVASTGKVKVTWEKVEGAVKYEVYRATSKTGTYSRIYTTSGTRLTNTSTTAGKAYYYKVRAVDANGNKSDFSNIVSRTCDLPRPEITLSNVASSGKIKISWAKIDGAAKYEVYRSTDNKTWKLLKSTTGTSLTNTSTTAGTTYYYKVRAIHEKSAANSAYSSVKSRTCDLARPEITLSNIASSGKIRISWKKIEGAVKYEVYRSTDNKTWKLLKSTTGTSLTNTSTTAGRLYYYKVKAIASKTAANSAYSEVKSRRCDLARPTLTVKLNSSGKPYLTWTKIEGAVKYEVYRSTDNKTWTRISTTTKTSLTNTSVKAGTTYYYKVRAIASNTAANSAYCTVKTIKAK